MSNVMTRQDLLMTHMMAHEDLLITKLKAFDGILMTLHEDTYDLLTTLTTTYGIRNRIPSLPYTYILSADDRCDQGDDKDE